MFKEGYLYCDSCGISIQANNPDVIEHEAYPHGDKALCSHCHVIIETDGFIRLTDLFEVSLSYPHQFLELDGKITKIKPTTWELDLIEAIKAGS